MARKPFTPRADGQPGYIAGKVTGVVRHGHTVYGNPMMSVLIDIVSIEGAPAHSVAPVAMRISNDSGLVYDIESPEYRDEVHEFDVTDAGRISGYTRKPIA